MLKNLMYIALATMAFLSCKRGETIDTERRQLISPTNNFKVVDDTLKASTTSINFEVEDMGFNAEFNESVSWFITIKGLSSGAEKVISGTSAKIDPNNVEQQWDGASDNIYFFRFEESATAILSFYGSDQTYTTDTIFIVQKKTFDNECILIGEFEGDVNVRVIPGDPNSPAVAEPFYSPNCLVREWNAFFDLEDINEEICGGQYNVNPELQPKNTCAALGSSVVPKPVQGYGLFYLWGEDVADQPSNFFVGGFNHDPILYGLQGDLDNIFLNFYANPLKAPNSTKLKVELYGAGDDLFTNEISVDWTGWKQVSFRLSDLALAEAGAAGPGYLDPAFIKRMGFVILSDGANSPGTEAYIAIDFVTFTYGAPFDQNRN